MFPSAMDLEKVSISANSIKLGVPAEKKTEKTGAKSPQFNVHIMRARNCGWA
jgi:hypothetical protein